MIYKIYAWSMSAEGVGLYYGHDWSMSAHTVYNIYAWSMWAEGVYLYYRACRPRV